MGSTVEDTKPTMMDDAIESMRATSGTAMSDDTKW